MILVVELVAFYGQVSSMSGGCDPIVYANWKGVNYRQQKQLGV